MLRQGESVKWYWDMYGVSADVAVIALEENQRILIRWPSLVEWQFSLEVPIRKRKRVRSREREKGSGLNITV